MTRKLAQVASPILVMRPSRVLPPGRVLARCQAEEGSELTPAREGAASWIVATIADAVTGPTPGMVINRLAVASALIRRRKLLSIAPIASSSASIWLTSGTKCAAHAIGDHDLAILVEIVGHHAE